MKLVLILSIVVAFSLAKNLNSSTANKIIEMITRYGYKAEATSVLTQDGYILQLVRLQRRENRENEDKPPVLLMHGFMSSAEDWIYGGPSQGLAFYLADKGYDVYLGSARGSMYGQEHTRLNPSKDQAFWRFCWHEIGVRDLPAIINKVIEISRKDKINFIGHMEGATAFYVMGAELPEYNQKISKMVSLGPIAYMSKSAHPLLPKVVQHLKEQGWIMKNLGTSTFKPSTEVMQEMKTDCINSRQNQQDLCSNTYFLFNGYNSENMNETTIKQMAQWVPSGGSVREVLHFAHLKETGRFETYNELLNRKDENHEYDLSKINVPVSVFYASNDLLSHVDDVNMLIVRLPNIYKQKMLENYTNNLDLIYRNNIYEFYSDVLEALQ